MASEKNSPERPRCAVLSQSYDDLVGPALRAPRDHRVTFYSEREWKTAARERASAIYFYERRDSTAKVRYQARIVEMMLSPSKDADETQRILADCLPVAKEHVTNLIKGRRVGTLYQVVNMQAIDPPWALADMVLWRQRRPIKRGYLRSYALVNER